MVNETTCVYRHRRLDNNEVFYIGIGNTERPYKKYKSNRSKYWHNIINKTDYEVEIISSNLDVETAKELEIFLIQLYGRKDLGLGTLVNMTDGGDGCLNLKHSEETRKKQGLGRKNKPISESQILAIINANTGKKMSEESKIKMRLNNKKKLIAIGSVKKKKIIDTITGEIFNSMQECARVKNINYSTLQRSIKGKGKMFKHFKILNDE